VQVSAKTDTLCEMTEEHEEIVKQALADGVITPSERHEIILSARLIKLACNRQAVRVRLGTRMIRGGKLDREIMQDVRDYQELLEQEKAAIADQALAA
jgi:hypothetical protein